MTLKEKLEDECQSFQALALAEGISHKDAMRPTVALNLADKLMRAASVEDCQEIIQSHPDGVQAFWHVMEIVLDRARSGRLRPGIPPMKATGPLATVACSVLEYCEKMDDQFSENF